MLKFTNGASLFVILSLTFTPTFGQEFSIRNFLDTELGKLRDYKLRDGGCRSSCTAPGRGDIFDCREVRLDLDPTAVDRVAPTFSTLVNAYMRSSACCAAIETTCDVEMGKLTVSDNLSFLTTGIEFGKPYYSDSPSRMYIKTVTYENCTSLTQHASTPITFNITESDSVSFDRRVTDGQSTTVKVDFKFGTPIANAGVGASHTTSRQVSLSSGTRNGSSYSDTRVTNLNYSIAAGTFFRAQAIIYDIPASVEFSFEGEVDSSLSNNSEGISSASQVLDRELRTSEFNGLLESVLVSDVHVRAFETEPDCSNRGDFLESFQSYEIKGDIFSDELRDFSNAKVGSAAQDINNLENGTQQTPPDDVDEEPIESGGFCSATNDNGDASCSISCPPGESADCADATGSGTPTCECGP